MLHQGGEQRSQHDPTGPTSPVPAPPASSKIPNPLFTSTFPDRDWTEFTPQNQETGHVVQEIEKPTPSVFRRAIDGVRDLFRVDREESGLHTAVRLGCQALVMTGAMFGIQIIGAALQSHTGVSVGNSGAAEIGDLMMNDPAKVFLIVAAIGPVVEELLFRGIPSGISNLILKKGLGQDTDRPLWGVGIASSLLFAAAHGLSVLPVPQFAMGMFLWHVCRNYGLKSSVAIHVAFNASMLGLAYGLSGLFG